jgi:hypothetical protein
VSLTGNLNLFTTRVATEFNGRLRFSSAQSLTTAQKSQALDNLGLSADAKSIVQAASYAAIKTLLALTIGVNVQAWAPNLDTFATKTFDTDNTLAANSASAVPSQSAVKSYVDNLITGLKWKPAVRVSSTGPGTLATSFAAGQVVDGVTLVLGNRIMLRHQATASQNGLRIVTAGTPTRAPDADTAAEIAGCTVMVEEGALYGDTQWTCTNNENLVLDTDPIVFAQIAGAGTYSAGTGLQLTGNQFSTTLLGTANTWALAQTFTAAPVFTDQSGARAALGLATIASSASASDLSAGTLPDARLTGAYTGITSLSMNGTLTNSAAGGADNFFLNGPTSNWIRWNANGIGIPSFTTRSAGTKIVLRDTLSGVGVDYGIGIASSTLWFSIPSATPKFAFYAGVTSIMELTGAGVLSVGGSNVLLAANIGSTVQAYHLNLAQLSSLSFLGGHSLMVTMNGSTGSFSTVSLEATGIALAGAVTAADARSTLALGNAALESTGTAAHTIPFLDGVNTWSANNTFQSTAAASTALNPTLTLFRNSPTVAAGNNIGTLNFDGQNSSIAQVTYGRMFAHINDPTAGAHAGELRFHTAFGGTISNRFVITLGLYSANATGGDQGADTINATTLYEAGASLVTKYGTLASSNDWTAVNTFQNTSAASGTSNPIVGAYRNSPTVAANNAIGMFGIYGNNSSLVKTRYASFGCVIDDPTNGAESAHAVFQTLQAGINGSRLSLGLGLYTQNQSDNGANTISAATFYESGSPLASLYAPILPIYRALTANVNGTNTLNAQQWFPTLGAVTLPASSSYFFEGKLYISRSAGANSHTTSLLFAGTSTLTSIEYTAEVFQGTAAPIAGAAFAAYESNAATALVVTAASTSTTEQLLIKVKGVVRISAGGTFIPQFKYSAAPGGAPSIQANSYFRLIYLGADTAGSNGAWS